jgi:hypothetical protein
MFPMLYNRSKRKNRSVASAMTSENWIQDLMHELNPTLLIEYIRLWMLRNYPTMPTILEMMTSFGRGQLMVTTPSVLKLLSLLTF